MLIVYMVIIGDVALLVIGAVIRDMRDSGNSGIRGNSCNSVNSVNSIEYYNESYSVHICSYDEWRTLIC